MKLSRAVGAAIALALLGASAVIVGCDEAGRQAGSSELQGDALLERGEALYSQGKEELLIRHFFGDRRGGVFVDAGAYHWKELSTTLYLEKHLGWTGISIDANDALAAGYAENRPGTKFVSYIVTDHSGTTETFYLAHGAEGVSSASREWIPRIYEAFFPKAKMEIREVSVPTITLDELLDAEGIEKIDLLSMDIEGSELLGLAGFDIERFRPDLVCVEVAAENKPGALDYFREHGYERIEAYDAHDWVNWYFRPS